MQDLQNFIADLAKIQSTRTQLITDTLFQVNPEAKDRTRAVLNSLGIKVPQPPQKVQQQPQQQQIAPKPQQQPISPYKMYKDKKEVVTFEQQRQKSVDTIQQQRLQSHLHENARLEQIKYEIKEQIEAEKQIQIAELRKQKLAEREEENQRKYLEILKRNAETEIIKAKQREAEAKAELYLKQKQFISVLKLFQLFKNKIITLKRNEKEGTKQNKFYVKRNSLLQFKMLKMVKQREREEKLQQLKEEIDRKEKIAEDLHKFNLGKRIGKMLMKAAKMQQMKIMQEQTKVVATEKEKQIEEFIQRQILKQQQQQQQQESADKNTEKEQETKNEAKSQINAKELQKPSTNLRQTTQNSRLKTSNVKVTQEPRIQKQPEPAQEPVTQQPKIKAAPIKKQDDDFINKMKEREQARINLKLEKEKMILQKKQKEEAEKMLAEQKLKEKLAYLKTLTNLNDQHVIQHAFKKLLTKSKDIAANTSYLTKKHNKYTLFTYFTKFNEISKQTTLETKIKHQKLTTTIKRIQAQFNKQYIINTLQHNVQITSSYLQKGELIRKHYLKRSFFNKIRSQFLFADTLELQKATRLNRTIMLRTGLKMLKFNIKSNKLEKESQFRIKQQLELYQLELEDKNYDFHLQKALDDKFALLYQMQQPNILVFHEIVAKWKFSQMNNTD
ncbi:Hypothetical_protein [Hexamita inflata]|uniref:Hypothetical_protein n=1 Tax=Hexamita inflata TaxID=28002 RepID=A0AA86RN07_9EUKA|nr:Hypothetical protein HINF_LOCUS64193 [Hexamita inflata]